MTKHEKLEKAWDEYLKLDYAAWIEYKKVPANVSDNLRPASAWKTYLTIIDKAMKT
jgi:hypothetical protein